MSCVSDNYRSQIFDVPSDRGYVTYTSLPADHAGDAYYHNDRYYTGGRYEPGIYTYQGRKYDHRYFHNGQYLYGGDFRQQDAAVTSKRPAFRASKTGYVTYRNLPRNYSGDAYYYNNRYYAGGRYEPGVYTYQGRKYDHRYFHNGQYLYGGDYRQQASAASAQNTVQRSAPNFRRTRPLTQRVSY